MCVYVSNSPVTIYTDIYPLVASNQHLRVKFNNSADEDDEIWLLLTRHVVDTRRTSEYIALRVQIEDDTSPGSGSGDLNRIAVRVCMDPTYAEPELMLCVCCHREPIQIAHTFLYVPSSFHSIKVIYQWMNRSEPKSQRR